MNKHRRIVALWLGIFCLVQTIGWAQEKGAKPARALPPKWKKETLDTFFTDARTKLVGERPALGTGSSTTKSPLATPMPMSTGGEESTPAGGVFAWSKLISREALEDEVKAERLLVDETVTTPGAFKGGGNRDARKQFSTLAVIFAIIAEYDGQVRWQKEAPGLRDAFGQAGVSCKVGTDQSYAQSKLRQQDLADMIGGGTAASAKEGDAKAAWDKVSNRPPLMQRMEDGFLKRLQPWLSSEASFKENNDKILHEAQILAAMAEVIQRDGFEFSDDETYLGYAKEMRDGAVGIVEGVKTSSYDKANQSAGIVTKACSSCHEGYRS